MILRLLLSCALLASATAAAQEDYNAIFKKAVDAVAFEFDTAWAYTETRINSEGTWKGRFDPSLPPGERWQLLSVDGRDATEEEVEEYLEDKYDDNSREGDERVDALVEPDSIRLIEDGGDYWLLGFTPDEEDILESVDATIRIDKDGGQLVYIDLRNHETVRPAIGIRISKLITRLTFGPAVDGGPIVPLATQVEVKGRAYLVVSFDEQEIVRNSDFVFVGGG